MFISCAVSYSRAPVDRHNHYGHDRTRDPELAYAFDGKTPLFLEGRSQERIETIRSGDYRALREIITETKFSVPNEDASIKPHFLFVDSTPNGNSIFNCEREHWYYTKGDRRYLPAIERQVSFMFLQRLTVPRLMRYTLTNKKDSVKAGSLKYDSSFRQEGLYGVNIIGLRSGFVNEDAPVNEVAVVSNTFGNEIAKTKAQ